MSGSKRKRGKDFWGPPVWTTIHILALGITAETGKYYGELLYVLTKILPCDYCKINLMKKLQTYPPESYIKSPKNAFLYSYMIHDLANQHITQHTKETKISPSFDDIERIYVQGSNHGPDFWGPPIWTAIHVLAVTLRPEYSHDYKKFLQILCHLLPDNISKNNLRDTLERYPIEPYLRNNHDIFFYSYMIHDIINKKIDSRRKSPPYTDVKTFYFSSLGEECNDCRV